MSVFTLAQHQKEARLLPELAGLLDHHRVHCPPYARILDALRAPERFDGLADLPWLPVGLFKTHTLRSITDEQIFKVLTSSGTTGEVSRIYLDRDAAASQTRMLSATLRSVLGPGRLPMLVVDTRAIIKDRRSYSARGAGVLGMTTFGRDHVWVLDEHERPDLVAVKEFLRQHGGAPFLLFGFTFMVWLHLYQLASEAGLDLSNGILVHSGGWKRLADRAVDNAEFRRRFAEDTGLVRIHNFYGMVEQIGTIFLENPEGTGLHCPDFADVIVRDPRTWEPLPPGQVGLLEVVSTLPRSYPGNVLLTEDLGIVHGVDDAAWPGKRFSVRGRLPRAEARGCSDTLPPDPGGSDEG